MGRVVLRSLPAAALLVVAIAGRAQAQDGPGTDGPPAEPALPAGLAPPAAEDDEPSLPSGLQGPSPSAPEPGLPTGLQPAAPGPAPAPSRPSHASSPRRGRPAPEVRFRNEARVGSFVGDALEARTLSIAEVRTHLDVAQAFEPGSTRLQLVVDAIGDALTLQYLPQLKTGRGAIDLRTASLTTTPTAWLDLRVGRQILTWGTGDLLFINDLFPKDWTSFLIGRDVEYLKAPSDSAKISLFAPRVALDVVFSPVFDPDRLPLRHRISTWEPSLGRIAGSDTPLTVDRPDRFGVDSEIATRLHAGVGAWEIALYGYAGFWKSPAGFDPTTRQATFPPLAVYGASARGTVLGGIGSVEFGYYDSLDDRSGRDPFVRNSEGRLLLGYEGSPSGALTLGAQYYAEWTSYPTRHVLSQPEGTPATEGARHLLTTRVRWLALHERLLVSIFVFFSPSDLDGYLRARVGYAVSDTWHVEIGGNLFAGRDDFSFFGQLQNDSNVYFAVRSSL